MGICESTAYWCLDLPLHSVPCSVLTVSVPACLLNVQPPSLSACTFMTQYSLYQHYSFAQVQLPLMASMSLAIRRAFQDPTCQSSYLINFRLIGTHMPSLSHVSCSLAKLKCSCDQLLLVKSKYCYISFCPPISSVPSSCSPIFVYCYVPTCRVQVSSFHARQF